VIRLPCVEAELRARWKEFHELSPDLQAQINATRLLDVDETISLLDRALKEQWFGPTYPQKSVDKSTCPAAYPTLS
jgi:hypothetical protein